MLLGKIVCGIPTTSISVMDFPVEGIKGSPLSTEEKQ